MPKYYEERSLTLRLMVPVGTKDEEILFQLKCGVKEVEKAMVKEAINALERGEKTVLVDEDQPRDTKGRFAKKAI